MDLNFSQESFAFSDIAPPSHVSGLESFSDFDASECSEASFAQIEVKKKGEGKDGMDFVGNDASQPVSSLERSKETNTTERLSVGLEGLNANNIDEFFEAIQNAESLGIISSSNSGKSLAADESSLGILQLDGLPDFGDNLSLNALEQASLPQDRTLVGDDENGDEIVINHHDTSSNLQGDDIPFTCEWNDAGNLTPLATRNTLVQFEEERPDTGQDPDTFFSSHNSQVEEINNDTANEPTNEEPLRYSYGQEELDMMLQGRSGSGDGGELIDRVSLTSSISFIQSQTFPESIFSQSFSSSRGLGSGMDSRSESDGHEDNDDNTLPLLHGAGDGSNGSSTGRPGLEGGNSDAEDLATISRVPLDASSRLEAQGLELRQSAEGVDVLPDVLGDGGGGGDGSSGNNSDADDGGPAGAAYASSSANAMPSSTFPPTIASFGFIHQPAATDIQNSSALLDSDGLSAGRGCPVGDAAADRSPVLLPSPPEQRNELRDSLGTPHPSNFQASSTPMVQQEYSSRNVHDETSALESYYLLGHNAPRGSDTTVNTPHPPWGDDSSFHMSQLQGNRLANLLTEAESLNFDPPAGDIASGNQDRDMTLIPRDTGLEAQNIQHSNQGSDIWYGERSASSTALSNHSSEFSIKFSSSSAFMNGSADINESQMWKSTPRDDDEAAIRATPGVVFQGHQRPSTVTGQVADSKQSNSASPERSSDGEQSTVLGNSQMAVDFSSGQHLIEQSHDRTLTPERIMGDFTAEVPQVNGGRSSAFPWQDNEPDPFSTEGEREHAPASSFQAASMDQLSWPFGGEFVPGMNPFDGKNGTQESWMMPDCNFEPQGDALAVIDADEQIFNKEHELEIPSQAQISDSSKLHDWTIPDSHFVTRPSLLKVVGINDPNGTGEVRISMGAFFKAGSEELGSLSRTSPGRPRPHFGDEKPILTPSPKGALRLISETATSSDPFLLDNNSPGEDFSNRPTAGGDIKEVTQKPFASPDEVSPRPQTEEQLKRKKIPGEEARNVNSATTQLPASLHTDMLSFEMQKLKLDEQFKGGGPVKRRSRSGSQTSSSSTGSVQSVIKKSDGQSSQPGRGVETSDRSRAKERKRSHRKDKQESQNKTKLPLDVSLRTPTDSEQKFQKLNIQKNKMPSLRRSSYGDAMSTSSLEELTQFIAQAINEDPDEIRKRLAAAEKEKTKKKSKRKQSTPSEDQTASSNSRTSDFNPLASSSPQRHTSPEKITYSQVDFQESQQHTISDSPNKLSSCTVEDSVFPSEDATSMVPLSLKELDSKDVSSQWHSMPSPEAHSFHHVIPEFGETYTVRRPKKLANQQQHAPMIDPRKHRTQEIEQRLNRSLPRDLDSSAVNDDRFPHSLPMEQPHPSNQEMTTSQSNFFPLEASDSAVESMTTVPTQDNTSTRHSWPEATPSPQHQQKQFSNLDHVSGNTSQQSSNTMTEGPTSHAVPSANFRAPVQPGKIGEGPPPTVSMHGHHAGNLANQGVSPMGAPLAIAQGMVPFSNPGTLPHLYPSNNINGPIGIPGTMGPVLGGNSFNMPMHGPLSNTVPSTYGPRMVPLGSTVYPPQEFATMNTFHGHVPFVQTVSASMGPKPSSLTPTYAHSLNVDIPPNMANQQIPLHLRTNTSNMSDLPSSFTHPMVSTSMPYQQTPPQQVPNGLLQVRPDFSQGAVMSSTQEIIPGEIKFPPFCCVGVLTESLIPLHNSSSRWMHCEIHFILSTANGVQVPSTASAFSLQSKAIIAPHTTENVRISIEPVEAGTYTAQLQVYSFPVVCDMQPVAHSLGPVLALEVVAEEPQVEILLEDENTLHFGEVSWGAKQCRPIHLVNRGRAQVPIRLIISANSSSLHCFAFADVDFSPKAGIRNFASAKGAALTIHTLTLKGRKDLTSKVEPTVVLLLFQSPKMGLNSSSQLGPPEEYIARLDVEIDSARQGPTISSVSLKAIEGLVRLLTPHKLQELTLKSSVGKSTSCKIPIKNAGNITARVKIKVEGDSQQFSALPAQLHLKPQEESVVQVVYQPTEANKQVQSLVVLAVPSGPVYELVVKGSAVPKEEDKVTLSSNKPVLCWSGVALGRSQRQKVVLMSNSSSPVNLQLMIGGNHSDFQIQPTFSSHAGSPEQHQVTLQPEKGLAVHVSFSPSSMGLISSSLVIRSLGGNTKSMIPLYGCGGTSQLLLVDIRQLSEGYVLNIGEVSLGRKNSVKVKLRNSGTRAAFVKVVCYSDVPSLQRYPSTHLNVIPDNFILSQRTSKTVLIEYQPLERDAIKCRTAVNSVAAVAFYTGDEFLRRHYKRNLQRNPRHFSSEVRENPLAGIDFTSTFQDEDKLVEDVKYPKVANWDTFFKVSISRVLLTLVGSPPGSNPVNKNDPNRSVDIAPVSVKPAAMPQLPNSATNGNPDEKNWSVIPDFLTLTTCKSKDDQSAKSADQLRIVNLSERSLGFEFTWPGHAIVITPERGEIPPRSQTKVFVSAKPNPANSFTHLPWGGTIYLNCDGMQQSIRVQIREEQVLESSPLQPGTLSFQSIPTTVAGGTPLPSNHLPPLRVKNKDIVFDTTLIGAVTTSEIFLTNTAPSDVAWNLTSVAPAYVKVDDTGSIHRTTYSAFSIRKLFGSVEGHGTAEILVKFQPRDVGEYEQSWDLMTSSSPTKSEKQKIFLHGQAVQKFEERQLEDTNTALTAKTKKVTIKEPLKSIVGDKKGLYVTESILQFPVTTVGSVSASKVKICNGSGEIQYVARVTSLAKPFGVNNSKFTVRPGHFVRLPVTFSPTEPDKVFEASLVITGNPDGILSLKLQGSSAE